MKKALVSIAMVCVCLSTAAYSSEFLSENERKAVFCGKTYDGENIINGWKYKTYVHDTCDRQTIHYLTGDSAGQTFVRPVTRYPSGETCVKLENGRDRCTKAKDVGNGVYHIFATNGRNTGEHVNTVTNFVDGNKLP